MAYRHAVFNVLAHNRDDHLKQFSFRRRGGMWARTPAYDLTFSHGPGGEHTLLVAGEGRHPREAHLRALGEQSALAPRMVSRVLTEVRAAVTRWLQFADQAGVHASRRPIGEVLAKLDDGP